MNLTADHWFRNPILRLIDHNAPPIIAILCQADQAMPPVKIHLNKILFFFAKIFIFLICYNSYKHNRRLPSFFKSKNIFITIYNFWKIYEKVLWKKFLFETNMITQVERKKGEKICIFLFFSFLECSEQLSKTGFTYFPHPQVFNQEASSSLIPMLCHRCSRRFHFDFWLTPLVLPLVYYALTSMSKLLTNVTTCFTLLLN